MSAATSSPATSRGNDALGYSCSQRVLGSRVWRSAMNVGFASRVMQPSCGLEPVVSQRSSARIACCRSGDSVL